MKKPCQPHSAGDRICAPMVIGPEDRTYQRKLSLLHPYVIVFGEGSDTRVKRVAYGYTTSTSTQNAKTIIIAGGSLRRSRAPEFERPLVVLPGAAAVDPLPSVCVPPLNTPPVREPLAVTVATAAPIVALGTAPGAPSVSVAFCDSVANPTDGGSARNTEYTFFKNVSPTMNAGAEEP